MAKKTAMVLGVVFIGIGMLGFVWPGFLGAHLSPAHNAIHLASGAFALYFGRSSHAAARKFCLAFGTFYLLLGATGFLIGKPAVTGTSMGGEQHQDSKLWSLLPGRLEFGNSDHVIHVAVGGLFVAAGLARRRSRGEEMMRKAAA